MLTPSQIEAIREYARARPQIVAVYLFGSAAEGRARPGSDVDLAVMTRWPLSGEERLEMEVDLSARLGRDVDLVVFETADPVLKHEILRPKALLYEADRAERIRKETLGRHEYLDTRWLHREVRRLADGG